MLFSPWEVWLGPGQLRTPHHRTQRRSCMSSGCEQCPLKEDVCLRFQGMREKKKNTLKSGKDIFKQLTSLAKSNRLD